MSKMYGQTRRIKIERKAVKYELEMRTQFVKQDQSSGCSSELDSSQVIKIEPCYQDQDEELFSLANLAGRIKPLIYWNNL